MIRKLRIKFVAINMAIVSLLLCVILGLVYYFTQTSLESQSVRMMQQIAAEPTRVEAVLQSGDHVRLPYFMVRLDKTGNFLAPAGGSYHITDEELLRQLVSVTKVSPQRLGEISRYNLRYCKVDTPKSKLLVFADISGEQAALDSLMKTCLLLGALGFLCFLIASILLSGWAVRPVEKTIRQQKNFVADASHELKTPLTVIMTDTQLLQTSGHSPNVQARLLNNIQTMCEQMRAMIEQMLQLAQSENNSSRKNFQSIDFSKLVCDSILPFDPVFYERSMKLETATDPGIRICGDPTLLRQLLEILLDNAQKYGDPGGTTWVSLVRCSRKRCRLIVADQGAPIPKESLKLIFERFYRGDTARRRNGSFGLGLSIARNIAEQHHAKIWAESCDGINRCIFEISCFP